MGRASEPPKVNDTAFHDRHNRSRGKSPFPMGQILSETSPQCMLRMGSRITVSVQLTLRKLFGRRFAIRATRFEPETDINFRTARKRDPESQYRKARGH